MPTTGVQPLGTKSIKTFFAKKMNNNRIRKPTMKRETIEKIPYHEFFFGMQKLCLLSLINNLDQ